MARAACATKFKHLQSPDGRSSMQINTDILLQAFAKPRWQEQRAQRNSSIWKALMAGAAANEHRHFTTSICKAPMARTARK